MLLGLRVGDPHDELLGGWLAKESVRDIYLTDNPAEAALLIDKAIAGCGGSSRRPRWPRVSFWTSDFGLAKRHYERNAPPMFEIGVAHAEGIDFIVHAMSARARFSD